MVASGAGAKSLACCATNHGIKKKHLYETNNIKHFNFIADFGFFSKSPGVPLVGGVPIGDIGESQREI
jgi:hypothetical protein